MKKQIFLIISASIFLVLTFFSFFHEKKEDNSIIKEQITEYFSFIIGTPFEVNQNIDLDSLLNSYPLILDTINPFYRIISEYDSASQKIKSEKFYNHKNKIFAKECYWYWMYDDYSEIIEDTSICKDFDHYRDWYKNEFPDGGVILDAFLHSDGTREIIYHHGPGCACCGDANIKFKTVRFYYKDDPRKIIKDYSFTNQILSKEDIEYLSKQIGANSFKIKIDSMNNINLSSLKLNNYFFNDLKTDFVILKKKADFFY